jgi:dipeptidyl aminopeptidase/acylaminoacyl peptidase
MMDKIQKNMKMQFMKYLVGVGLFVVILFHSAFGQEFVKPPDNLLLEGIPQIPVTSKLQLNKYATKTSSNFHGWSGKDGSLIGYSNYGKPVVLRSPKDMPQELDVVLTNPDYFAFQPQCEKSLIFAKRNQTDANSQLYQYDVETKQLAQISNSTEVVNVGSFEWKVDGTGIYFSDQRKKEDKTKIYHIDETTKETNLLLTLDDEYFYLIDINKDYLIVKSYLPNNKAIYSLLNLKTREMKPFTTSESSVNNAKFSKISNGIWFLSNKEKEFNDLYYYDIDKQTTKKVNDLEINISDYSLSTNEGLLAINVNEFGANSIRVFEMKGSVIGTELNKPKLSAGVINSIGWRNNEELGFDFQSTQIPPEIKSYNTKTNSIKTWTKSTFNADIKNKLEESELIKWKSFDNKEITGFLIQPKLTEKSRRFPVIIDIHGGPSMQFQPNFDPYSSYIVTELSTAIIFPNIRGSSGFGKEFEEADDISRREDAIKDLQALLSWIETQPQLDSQRIFIKGASYGAFVALSLGLKNNDRIKGIIAEFPLISIKNDLLNLSGNVREFREGEFGSLQDEKLMNQLEKLSLLGNDLSNWKIPIYFIIGKNDKRTVTEDARNVKNQLKNLQKDVWFLEAENEGHGFSIYENYFFSKMTEFTFFKNYLTK